MYWYSCYEDAAEHVRGHLYWFSCEDYQVNIETTHGEHQHLHLGVIINDLANTADPLTSCNRSFSQSLHHWKMQAGHHGGGQKGLAMRKS